MSGIVSSSQKGRYVIFENIEIVVSKVSISDPYLYIKHKLNGGMIRVAYAGDLSFEVLQEPKDESKDADPLPSEEVVPV